MKQIYDITKYIRLWVEFLVVLFLRAGVGGSDWGIPQAQRMRYNQMFSAEDRTRKGHLTGKCLENRFPNLPDGAIITVT